MDHGWCDSNDSDWFPKKGSYITVVKVTQCSCNVVYQQVPLIAILASEFPHAAGISYFLDGSCDERWKAHILRNLGLQKRASTLGAQWTNATVGNQKALDLKPQTWQLRESRSNKGGSQIQTAEGQTKNLGGVEMWTSPYTISGNLLTCLRNADLHFKAPSSPSVGR